MKLAKSGVLYINIEVVTKVVVCHGKSKPRYDGTIAMILFRRASLVSKTLRVSIRSIW